jgi:hypothetical protein
MQQGDNFQIIAIISNYRDNFKFIAINTSDIIAELVLAIISR